MKKKICALGACLLTAGLANAVVISEFEFSTTESFSKLPNVSNTDLATGIDTERSFWSSTGNFDATRATDGLFGDGFGNNIPNQTTEDNSIVRYKIDLGSAQEIGTVNSYAYGDNGDRSKQNFSLYGSATDTASFDETDATWTLICTVDTRSVLGTESYGVTSIYDEGGGALGTYWELMWVTSYASVSATLQYESTIYKEFDVLGPTELETIGDIAIDVSGGQIVLSWEGGLTIDVWTNANLIYPNWGIAELDVDSPVTNTIGSESQLFYELRE